MNPILKEYTGEYGEVPFSEFSTKDFMPAINVGIEEAYNNIEMIKHNQASPDFYNTVEALELSSNILDNVTSIYFNLYSLESDSNFKQLSEEISPLLAKFSGDIYTDSILFEKIKMIYESDLTNLNNEEKRLLENTYKEFIRNGALLSDQDKEILKDIDKELSTLSPKFSKNTLEATNAFEIHVLNKDELKGIPENAITSANDLAKSKGYDNGWVFNLQMPSYLPVIQYAENRELRKKLSNAYGIKNLDGEFDNREIILNIIKLRDKRAKLLGYNTHSDYILEKRMASNPDTVFSFLENIYNKAKPYAENEVERVFSLANKTDKINVLQSWDFQYYSEKLKKELFDFNTEELRPYLKSDNVINGIFKVANLMYELNFESIDLDVYHKDVKTYKVTDNNNKYIGLLYVDLYPRETKQGGAWMNTIITQGYNGKEVKRPHIVISGNLTPASSSTPSLLSFDEVRTLFHEFGHALHGLLSDVKYRSLASPNVLWDFVELPSQIMENWLMEEETLSLFAKHYQTGEIIPKEFIKKIKDAQNFNAGYMNLRQLSFGFLDMNWYTTNPDNINDVESFEDKIMDRFRLFPKTNGNMSTGFGHIFAGGYSSGYYSYKWAEVLDADAFELFKEKGIFNKEIANSFKKNILSKGNTVEPMDLYIKFRGRKPDPEALLKRDGLI